MKIFFFFLETTWFWAEKTFEFPISAEQSLSISVKTLFFFLFGDHGGKNVRISNFGRKITFNCGEDLFFCFVWRPRRKKRSNFQFRPKNHFQFWWRPFFFFFFGDHGGKNVRISDFGRKITLNFGEDIRIFEGLCLKSPPHQNFLNPPLVWAPPIKNPGYAYGTTSTGMLYWYDR